MEKVICSGAHVTIDKSTFINPIEWGYVLAYDGKIGYLGKSLYYGYDGELILSPCYVLDSYGRAEAERKIKERFGQDTIIEFINCKE